MPNRTISLPAIACSIIVAWAAAIFLPAAAAAGSARWESYDGEPIVVLEVGDTLVRCSPSQGANVFSIRCAGVEYVKPPESKRELAGVRCGVPVLYPTPNRVRGARLEFNGTEVRFESNAGQHFIHGLVNRHAWKVENMGTENHSAWLECTADFRPNTPLYARFPFPHVLRLRVEVRQHVVRWQYTVDNSEGNVPVPFGFALHPYFLYQREREQTYLTIPATHWMEAKDKIPTGRLIPAKQLDFPLGAPIRLADYQFDDVFYGLTPARPVRIEFRDVNHEVLICASQEFTHLVVWTPDNRPFFGVESQTCSTDAHNLHARGLKRAAHLQVCPPGGQMKGWVEYRVIQKQK